MGTFRVKAAVAAPDRPEERVDTAAQSPPPVFSEILAANPSLAQSPWRSSALESIPSTEGSSR